MDDRQYDRPIDWVMLSGSLLSMVFSFPVIMTIFIFNQYREKIYIKLVVYMSISNFISALSTSVGTPASGTPSCYFEGVVSSAGTIAGVFWAVVISSVLFSILVYEKVLVINIYTHLFCWTMPVILAVLPFINATYGGDDDISGWCFIAGISTTSNNMILFWYWFSFYAPLWTSMIVIIILFIITLVYARNVNQKTRGALKKSINKLQGFPWIIFISWLVQTICDTTIRNHPNIVTNNSFRDLYLVGVGLGVLQGFFTSIYFFYCNQDVLFSWWKLISTCQIYEDRKVRSSFISSSYASANVTQTHSKFSLKSVKIYVQSSGNHENESSQRSVDTPLNNDHVEEIDIKEFMG
jgi:hypothetical protein